MIEIIDHLLELAKSSRAYGVYLKSDDKPRLTYNQGPRYREAPDVRVLTADELNAFASTLTGYFNPNRNQNMWSSHYKGYRVHVSGMLSHTHVVFIDETTKRQNVSPEEPQVIREFQGEYRWLSNFWETPAWYGDVQYPTAEHAYQAAKFDDLAYREIIRNAARPHEAKVLGQAEDIPVRAGWHEGLYLMAMSEVVVSKFSNQDMAFLLTSTDGKLLVEGNKWHDNKFGVCMCGRPECEGQGKNQLGIILMTVRASLYEG